VFLSPRDRDRFHDYEEALAAELGGYLLEHARRERFAMVSKPVIDFETDERLGLGQFGIQTRVVQHPEEEGEERPAAQDPEAGRTMIYGRHAPVPEPAPEPARRRETPVLLLDGKRLTLGPTGVSIGRSRQCDIVLDDPNVSRKHAEIRPRGGAWVLSDLGSTNGSCLNGRRIDAPEALNVGDEVEIGTSVIRFERA
jgi:predicted component of type VI protein secretion system